VNVAVITGITIPDVSVKIVKLVSETVLDTTELDGIVKITSLDDVMSVTGLDDVEMTAELVVTALTLELGGIVKMAGLEGIVAIASVDDPTLSELVKTA